MLLADENETLTRVGPGTLMGDLLRRYWTPACLSAELPEAGCAPVRAKLLGEKLVAFRDTTGRVGLVQENCPHRGASLYFGRNEDAALRCVYHGWAFDADGRCVDMPSEPAPFCDKVRMRAYPVHESGGIVWAYLGPRETMTPFRDFGTDGRHASEFIAMKTLTACNWVQAMEGNIDSAHISFLHQWDSIADIPDDGSDKPGYPSNAMSLKFWRHDRAPRVELEETWYGFRYAGVRTTPNGNTHVRVTAYALPYSTMVAGIPFSGGQLMFVPVDDETCWGYFTAPRARQNPRGLGGPSVFSYAPFTTPVSAYATGVTPRPYTAGNDYGIDREVQRDGIFSGIRDFASQDLMAVESQGPVRDRAAEHLGASDRAVSKMRHVLLTAARALADGQEPSAVGGHLDFASIRGAEKILEPGEDWRLLGTNADPVVQEALGLS
jgi:phenylpropionate dioxygenase-like ring-hydroxylating dioxygenase large terminal subunit